MCLQPEQLSCCNCCHLFSLQLAHIFFSCFSSMIGSTFFLTFLFLFFLQMLYVDNLQHGLNTNPFSLPRCAFLDTSTIDSIANMDRRRDVSSETVEFGKLMVRTHTLLAHIPLLFFCSFFSFLLQLHWRQSCYLCTYIIAICYPSIHQLVNFYIIFYKKNFGSWGACLTHATVSLLLRHW